MDQNQKLNSDLSKHLVKIKFNGTLFFSSSTQEEKETLYGQVKKEARIQFQKDSKTCGFKFYFLKIPNVFGPFCKPYYNSFIATFSEQLINNKNPKILKDDQVFVVYVDNLIKSILKILKEEHPDLQLDQIHQLKVSKILDKLLYFKEGYLERNEFPNLEDAIDLNLFNTFRSYVKVDSNLPKKHFLFSDERGFFSELSRSGSKGQSSFSFTKPGVTRGNHFHTRKVERFSVIKGKARIKLRKYLTDEIISFDIDSKNPSFVDMPIWYTHSITNIGTEELLTFFWINEPYDEKDPDTYMEIV